LADGDEIALCRSECTICALLTSIHRLRRGAVKASLGVLHESFGLSCPDELVEQKWRSAEQTTPKRLSLRAYWQRWKSPRKQVRCLSRRAPARL
jgi:hypothetical protein